MGLLKPTVALPQSTNTRFQFSFSDIDFKVRKLFKSFQNLVRISEIRLLAIQLGMAKNCSGLNDQVYLVSRKLFVRNSVYRPFEHFHHVA